MAEWLRPEKMRRKMISPLRLMEAALAKGSALITSDFDRTDQQSVVRWDLGTGKPEGNTGKPNRSSRLTLSADGKMLAAADYTSAADRGRDLIRVYEVESDEQIFELDPGERKISTFAFSPDGSKLMSGFYLGSAIVWDLRRNVSVPLTKE